MSRLIHSQGGFIRSLQMSSARFFAFVEGRLDRSFFDRMLPLAVKTGGLKHQVIAIKEIPPGTGGKPALLTTFREFRKRGLLRATAFGKTMVCVFFADKDADDFCRTKLRSPHLIYSSTYDLEGHLYTHADLHRALADTCGLTLEQARDLIPDPKTWLLNAARAWRDWVALCLISQREGVNCGCTFDRVSQVNPDPFAPPNAEQVGHFKRQLSQSLSLSEAAIDKLFATAVGRMDASISAGDPLRYFKGKWLDHIIQRYLESKQRPADAIFSSAGDRLCLALLAQVAQTAQCACCAPYVKKLAVVTADI